LILFLGDIQPTALPFPNHSLSRPACFYVKWALIGRKGMKNQKTFITHYDHKRLREFLDKARQWPQAQTELIESLEAKMEEASVIDQKEAPPYLVTMNCHVQVRDLTTNQDSNFWLAYPDDAASGSDKVSVLSPLGIEVLGSKSGDTLQVSNGNKKRPVRVVRILYQPEEKKHYRL